MMNRIARMKTRSMPALGLVLLLGVTELQAAAPRRVAPSQGGTSSPPTRVSRRVAGSHEVAQGRATYGHHPWYANSYVYWDRYWVWPWWGSGSYWGWPYYVYGGPPYAVYPPYHAARGNEPAAIETDLRPRKATVSLDGEEVGQARDYGGRWDELLVEPGTHWLEFEAPGYKKLRVRVDAQAGRHYRVDYRLAEGEGVDARSDVPPPAGLESPSEKRLGHRTSENPSGMEGIVPSGFLRILARPDDSAVYLDGEFLARADELSRMHGALPVAVGAHRVEVVRPGYKSARRDIVMEEGRPAEVAFTLERGE